MTAAEWEPGEPLYTQGHGGVVRWLFELIDEEEEAENDLRWFATHPYDYHTWACLECETFWPFDYVWTDGDYHSTNSVCWCCGKDVRDQAKAAACGCWKCAEAG